MKYNIFAAILVILIVVLSVSADDPVTSTSVTTTSTTATPTGAPDPIAQCIEQRKCGTDQNCRAQCAGVPNPSDTQANATNTCVIQCNGTATDPEAYKACQQKCIDNNYFTSTTYGPSSAAPTGTSAGSSTSPSASQSAANSTPSSSSAAFSFHKMESVGINLFSILILWICFAAGAWSF